MTRGDRRSITVAEGERELSYPRLTNEAGALELARAIRTGAISVHEVVDSALARIEHLDVHINAVVACDFERAIDTARAMDGQIPRDDQPLYGVPMTVKESFDVAGLPTCWGMAEHAENIAHGDAAIVQRLKSAGAIILGKTNLPQELSDWQSFNPVYGRTNNPHDHSRSPGGSSGGGAAAVASGMVACEFGSDIGGSIRVPAHFSGVWGHKPSWGLVSMQGHTHPLFTGQVMQDTQMSVAGPLARNADDLELLMLVTAQLPLETRAKPLAQCRLLYLAEHPISPLDASVRQPLEQAVATLERAGMRIDRSSALLPDLAAQHGNYLKMMNIAMSGGAPAPDGTQPSARDWFALLQKQAANEAQWAELFRTYDFVLAAPAPVLAIEHNDKSIFRIEVEIDGAMRRGAEGLAWSGIATFPNLPSTVLPIGQSDCLPCGMQVIGPRWADLDCIAAARQIDECVNWGSV